VATASNSDVTRYRRNLRGEVDRAALYRMLAQAESSQDQPEALAAGMPADKRSHGRVFRAMVDVAHTGFSGATIARSR